MKMCRLGTVVVVLALGALFAPASSADSPIQVNPSNGHCYQRLDTPASWHAAKDSCVSLGAHLVSIHDPAENQFVFSHFVQNSNWSWLGGTDEDAEGTWIWASGEPWAFEAWNPGEPNNLNETEHYLTYFDTVTIGWNDVPDMALPYICEWSDPSCAQIFADGFESGDVLEWSASVPE